MATRRQFFGTAQQKIVAISVACFFLYLLAFNIAAMLRKQRKDYDWQPIASRQLESQFAFEPHDFYVYVGSDSEWDYFKHESIYTRENLKVERGKLRLHSRFDLNPQKPHRVDWGIFRAPDH